MTAGHRVFALFYPMFMSVYERKGLRERRQRLLRQAHGRVVEIGAGTGLNFAHYPAGVEVLATEPDPHMFKRARKAARASVTVEQAGVEQLPVEEGSVDTVVSTLVLCSVPDLARSVEQIARVLKPGGRLLLLEHVRASEPKLARQQDKAEKMQVRFGGGCHPNRETRRALEAAGFNLDGVHDERLPLPKLVRPGIVGVAVKP